MYCSNCGKKLSPEDYFCSNCGTPVLRQGLFDDGDADAHEDAFEETRLFTAEELGQYLNDVEEELPVVETQRPVAQMNQAVQTGSQKSEDSGTDKNVKAKAAAAEMMGAANAVAGKFKGKLSELKAKQAEKKQSQIETKVEEKREPAESILTYENDVNNQEDVAAVDEPVSMKKVVFPVIVLGLIIGLVIGLVLIQPWSSNDETANTNQTAVSTAMLIE